MDDRCAVIHVYSKLGMVDSGFSPVSEAHRAKVADFLIESVVLTGEHWTRLCGELAWLASANTVAGQLCDTMSALLDGHSVVQPLVFSMPSQVFLAVSHCPKL